MKSPQPTNGDIEALAVRLYGSQARTRCAFSQLSDDDKEGWRDAARAAFAWREEPEQRRCPCAALLLKAGEFCAECGWGWRHV